MCIPQSQNPVGARVLLLLSKASQQQSPAPEWEPQGQVSRDSASAFLGVFQREPSEYRPGVSVSGQMKGCFHSSCYYVQTKKNYPHCKNLEIPHFHS